MALHEFMKELTISSGVDPEQYDKFILFDGDITIKEITEKGDWLSKLRYNEYQKVLEVWRLLPPQTWDMYKTMGFNNLREQRLLREYQKALRRQWKKWYQEYNDRNKQKKNPGTVVTERV